jgi:hypothetical protein
MREENEVEKREDTIEESKVRKGSLRKEMGVPISFKLRAVLPRQTDDNHPAHST